MLNFFKKDTIKEKITNLNIILSTLEAKDIKYSVIYNISDDIVITISDKNSVKANIKETKKKKNDD